MLETEVCPIYFKWSVILSLRGMVWFHGCLLSSGWYGWWNCSRVVRLLNSCEFLISLFLGCECLFLCVHWLNCRESPGQVRRRLLVSVMSVLHRLNCCLFLSHVVCRELLGKLIGHNSCQLSCLCNFLGWNALPQSIILGVLFSFRLGQSMFMCIKYFILLFFKSSSATFNVNWVASIVKYRKLLLNLRVFKLILVEAVLRISLFVINCFQI